MCAYAVRVTQYPLAVPGQHRQVCPNVIECHRDEFQPFVVTCRVSICEGRIPPYDPGPLDHPWFDHRLWEQVCASDGAPTRYQAPPCAEGVRTWA